MWNSIRRARLTYFQAIPPQKEKLRRRTVHAVRLEHSVRRRRIWILRNFRRREPLWNSLAASDTRVAWTGTWPGTTRPLRVEAASFQGKPVFFSLIGDWTKPDRMKEPEQSTGKK